MQGLIYNSPYTKSYKTSTNSRILTLHRKDWENLLKHFPNSKKHIYKYLKDDGFDDDDDDDDNGSDGKKKQVKLVTDEENSPSIPDKLPPQQSHIPQTKKIEDVDFKKEYPDILPPGTSRDYDSTSSMEKLEVAPLEETAIIESSSSDSSTYDVEAKSATSHFDVESMNDELIKTTVKDLRKRDLRLENIDDLTDSDYIGDSDKSLTRDNKETSRRDTKKYKSLVEMESVEDYIANKRRKSRTTSSDAKKLVPIKEILPPNVKKRKHHVVIKESDSDVPPVESHELKPILNTATDKRNLKSLDSDMETTVKVENAKSSKDSLSDDRSVE